MSNERFSKAERRKQEEQLSAAIDGLVFARRELAETGVISMPKANDAMNAINQAFSSLWSHYRAAAEGEIAGIKNGVAS